MNTEKFSLVKAVTSLWNGLSWFKALMIGLKLLGIAFIAFTIYRAYFMKTTQNTQRVHVLVKDNASFTLKQDQNEDKKFVDPFIEVYGFCESDKRYGVGVKGGVRF